LSLINAWRNCAFEEAPYLLDGDEAILNHCVCYTSFQEYAESEELGGANNTKFHLGLIPQPYFGRLATASIFILTLNPGLGPSDYFAEYEVSGFREALLNNLRQDYLSEEYPFMFLDPQYAWHGGFDYWRGRFQGILNLLARRLGNYKAALSYLSQRVASLELVPYHSVRYGGFSEKRLESPHLMREFVHSVLFPRAQRGEIAIIVARQVKTWNVPEHSNVVRYDPYAARYASLSLASTGGRKILDFLGIEGS
jgi:hypothetical protein